MKKLLTILLALSMLASLAACGGEKNTELDENEKETIVQTDGTEENVSDDEVTEEKDENENAGEGDKEDEKPEAKPETTPEVKPEEKPETTPEVKPEEKPEEPVAKTLGQTLLSDFKSKAASMGTEELANALLSNPAIQFMGGAMPIEEGLLSGFDNAEITGFKSGAVFMPMIGSIPFIGYVFELENASDVSAFIKNLENNANRRWNICVEAEEMVTGSVGNKVFFVMCPKSLEE